MIILIIALAIGALLALFFYVSDKRSSQSQWQAIQQTMSDKLAENHLKSIEALHEFKEKLLASSHQANQLFDKHQFENLKVLQDSLQKGLLTTQTQVNESLSLNTKTLSDRVSELTKITESRLKEISRQVEKRLADGFEKTTQTFSDILKRLAIIDEAQKKITELSGNVVSLQDLLADKRSRGAFGEIQLNALIRNVLPEKHFSLQHTLSNAKRADCILFLPDPTGNLVIDAKFPLENYRRATEKNFTEADKRIAEQQFRQDIKNHINDIAQKYIIPGETADGAVMFIPAEAIFADIHAHYPELVEHSYKSKVWLVSPTTMMAILTTARAVLKDDATKKQVHVIQEHLQGLAKDFERFQTRMDKLQQHIGQANDDVQKINVSAKKITAKFQKIDQVELPHDLTSMIDS